MNSTFINVSKTVFNNKQTVQNVISLSRDLITRSFSISGVDNMRFVHFQSKNENLADRDIFDICSVDSSIPNILVQFLSTGNGLVEKAKRIVGAGKSIVSSKYVIFLPPITRPDKIACVGSGHCDEQNLPYSKEPMIFSKFSSCIVGSYDNVVIPPTTNCVDWEVELAVVIGKKEKAIKKDQAQDYNFGYTIGQDSSARDWQKKRHNGQFLLGKSIDTFCTLGPAVVIKETVNPENLNISSKVNGVLKQNGNTSELIFKIDFIVSYLSQIIRLYPGYVIMTGSPAGVGMHRSPADYLQPGDILESEIEGIGIMRNTIV